MTLLVIDDSSSHRRRAIAGHRRPISRTGNPLMAGSRLAHVTFLVDDYDRAIAFFTNVLDFELLTDTPLGPGKRWVLVAPKGVGGAALLLAKAEGAEQTARIGDQTGGRVGFFLETDDFAGDYAAFSARGLVFREAPRHESYATVAVFEDLYGNLWDLLQPAKT